MCATSFRASAGQARSTEWLHTHNRTNGVAVDIEVARLDAARDMFNGFIKARVQAKGEAIARAINGVHEFIQLLAFVTQHMQHWAKDFTAQFTQRIYFNKRLCNEIVVLGLFA